MLTNSPETHSIHDSDQNNSLTVWSTVEDDALGDLGLTFEEWDPTENVVGPDREC